MDAADLDLVPAILKGQFAVSKLDGQGDLIDARGLQIPGVLDDLYTYEGELGIVWDNAVPGLRVWAPTAQSVSLHLFADSTTPVSTTYEMTWDGTSGTWSVPGEGSWVGQYYLYEVVVYAPATMEIETNLVTDPYAVSLSMNSQRSQIVDLDDPALAPEEWTTYEKPPLDDPEDISVYEVHMRDFSVNDPAVPADLKGKYLAFTVSDSYGMQHLQALAQAGLSHLHLLPTFDLATINENPAERDEPDWDVLASYPPDSEEQQALAGEYREIDAFNWGYDPWHYTVPEGSYATNADSTARILEYREMVKALNDTGLRVVMDVVYNHTNASGQAERSVLDRVVPGYYHRLNPETGSVEMSSCCQNTASEHNMMEKLMIDSVVLWATSYKVDAFRFDLMGHHMKENMLNLQEALNALTEDEHGVDGSKIFLYGEGWNFGEVADNARGVNATQFNMAGTGIGTYNDRLRDAVRGGGPFDGGDDLIRNQGFSNGLYYDPNELNSGSETERERLLLLSDQIRVGLTGNLADFTFTDRNGNTVTGAGVDYNGQPAGYTQDPQENIVYASKHDNQTLYDNNAYKTPTDISLEDRVRVQNMGSDIVGLSQGVPFFQAGVDMLRSKSLDRNSYDSGDWFNKLDFTYMDNNWGVGLPPAQDNESNWDIMGPLLADPNLDPSQTHILQAVNHFQELLAIRASSSLFHLETEAEVMERLHFLNTGPDQQAGLIVMTLSDEMEPDLDGGYEYIVVLFNANDEVQSFTDASLAERPLVLHPVQVESTDPVVRESTFDVATGAFSIPARTTAVFVQPSEKLAVTLSEMGTGTATAGGLGLPLALLGITLAVGLLIARRRRAV